MPCCSDPEPEPADEVYARVVGSKLFGLSSREQPVRTDVFQGISEQIGGEHAAFFRYGPELRAAFQKKLVVKDSQAVPSNMKLSSRQPCGVAHPGLCPCKTPAVFDRGMYLSDRFTERMVRDGKVGSWYSVQPGHFD
eukprot:10031216-Alexandrium_andersonii.AAC.1